MMSVRRKIYRSLAVATSIACLVMTCFTWYVVGIIEKENTKEILEKRVNYVSDTLYKKEIKYNAVSNQISGEYKSRARALAVMLSKNPEITNDELQLEELRTAIGADTISFYDENLMLEFTTGSEYNQITLSQELKAAVNNKLYSSANINTSGEFPKVVVSCSRLDRPGIIQVEYMSENLDTILDMLDISEIFVGVPILKTGSLALIDNETMTYIAHTDEAMTGKPSHFNLKEDFFGADPFFDCEINGEDVLLHFDFCNNQLVIGYIPYNEINEMRNDTIQWILCAATIISLVTTLTIRSRILHINKKRNHNKNSHSDCKEI